MKQSYFIPSKSDNIRCLKSEMAIWLIYTFQNQQAKKIKLKNSSVHKKKKTHFDTIKVFNPASNWNMKLHMSFRKLKKAVYLI